MIWILSKKIWARANIFDLEEEVEVQVIKFSEHKMPSQAMKRNVNNFYHLLLKITEPAYDGHNDVSSEQIRAIQRELSIINSLK